MLGNLAFKSFLQDLSKRKTRIFKSFLKIFYKSFFIYSAMKGSQKATIGLKIGKSIKGLSWLDLGGSENFKRFLEVRFL